MDGNVGSTMEMVLMSLGSCSAIDAVSILLEGRNHARDCESKLILERREEVTRLFIHNNLYFVVTG